MKNELKQKANSIEDIRRIVGHELKPGKEGLGQISDALRLLEGAGIASFQWDYIEIYKETDCGSIGCAMGWGAVLWPEQIGRHPYTGQYQRILGVDGALLMRAFINHSMFFEHGIDNVKPHHVADELDRIAETLP